MFVKNYCQKAVTDVVPGGTYPGALQLYLYGGVWPQDGKIDPSAD